MNDELPTLKQLSSLFVAATNISPPGRIPNQMTDARRHFYVKAVTNKGRVTGYGVYREIDGVESERDLFLVTPRQSAEVALHIANTLRDDLNACIA